MARYDDGNDDLEPEEEDEYLEEEEEEEEEAEDVGRGRKRSRSQYIDDAAEEDDEEYEEEDDDDEDYGGGGGRGGAARKRSQKKSASHFFDEEAAVDSADEDLDEEEGEDDFINDAGAEIPDVNGRRAHRQMHLPREDDQEDVEALEKRIRDRFTRSSHAEYGEDTEEVDQQAYLPSVRDPKLWIVKCAIGREREAAVCLMQKYIDKGSELQIRSAIALDHLKNYIYVEADKEAHVREACKGLRNIYAQKIGLVPIREMTDVLSVESKAIDIARDTWVRMKIGKYKGDLAQVVDVDNVRQKVTVKLIPRVDLQALANKLEGKENKTKAFVPPPRLMNAEEARDLHIRVERRRDHVTGDYFEWLENMRFKDGFLHKTMSTKSIRTQGIQPTFDEIEKFRTPTENGDGDNAGLTTLFASRKKGHFLKGDAVVVIKGELKNMKGTVEKVDEDQVYIKPKMEGLPMVAVPEKELCKFFKEGNHVKVVSGAHEGATGTVVKVEGHVLIIVSDAVKEEIRVFADDVVESTEVTSGITKLGDYELRDLVLLDNRNFGVIIRVESEGFQVLKGVPDRAEVLTVKLRDIKCKLDRKQSVKERYSNTVSVQDVVRILEGPCQAKQGPVEHIYRGILFIFDRTHLEHAGFICAKAESCALVGGSRANGDRNGALSIFQRQTPTRLPASPARYNRGGGQPMRFGGRFGGGRGDDALVGTAVRIRKGAYKGCKGRVTGVKGQEVRIELESQMKVVSVCREDISDKVAATTPYRDSSRYGVGSETPMHLSRTPLHPYMTPMRDSGATPHHDGMRTPMRDRAWNPYSPMTPARESWEDGNPGSWASSPQYQPGSPPRRTYEAPTPGSGWAGTPGGSYSDAGTPRDVPSAYANAPSPYLPSTPGQVMTPGSASYLPGTPGGQPMTPGTGGLDAMSPIGGESEGLGFMPDILVTVRKPGEENVGVIREVLSDGSCRVSLGTSGRGDTVRVVPTEMELVPPRKSDRIKIMGGALRGHTGKLIGVDGTDGIVKVDSTLDVKILDLVMLAKLA